ncbi:MAG: PTS sugar transporter subunit IIA [Calditrichaeota bacterium]|nr:PTS sugar transporter subunit IIA [Calditrichota bacterium]
MQLTDLLNEDHILIPLKCKTRDECIRTLIESIHKDGLIDDIEKAYLAILEREKLMTTGVGNGIAIPHCKHNSCPNFAVAFGIHPKGVDFEAIDKKKVHLIFLLVGPENNPSLHIKLLSRISRLMSNEELREQLLECKSPREALELLKEEEGYYFELE